MRLRACISSSGPHESSIWAWLVCTTVGNGVVGNFFQDVNLVPTVDHKLIARMKRLINSNVFNSCSLDRSLRHGKGWLLITFFGTVKDHRIKGSVWMCRQVPEHFVIICAFVLIIAQLWIAHPHT